MAYVKFTWKNKGVGTETPLDETNLNHLEEGVKGEEERALAAEGERLKKAENLKDLASASTARTNLGLGTAATSASTAFDAAGAAATAQSKAEANSIPSSAKGKAGGVPSSVGALAISGTPSSGQVLTATSATASDWQTPSSGVSKEELEAAETKVLNEAAGAGFGFGQAATWPPRKPASGDAVTALGMMLGGGVTLYDKAPAESLHWQRISFPYGFNVTHLKVHASVTAEAKLNLGLYDEEGKLLHSAEVTIPASGKGVYGVEIPSTAVEAGKMYWTGVGVVTTAEVLAVNLGQKDLHELVAGGWEAKGELCLFQEPVAGGVLPATIPWSSLNNSGSLYGMIVRVEGTA